MHSSAKFISCLLCLWFAHHGALGQEVLKYDTHNSQGNFVKERFGQFVLEDGRCYTVEASGTMSIWPSYEWVSPCGAAESSAMHPSIHEDGNTAFDMEYCFSLPDNARCQGVSLPYAAQRFQFSLDGGVTWFTPNAQESGYQASHIYTYELIGQGYSLGVRQNNIFPADDYGEIWYDIGLNGRVDTVIIDSVEVCEFDVLDSLLRMGPDTLWDASRCNYGVMKWYEVAVDTSSLTDVLRCPNDTLYMMLMEGEHYINLTTEDGCDSVAHIRLIDQVGPADTSHVTGRQSDFAAYLPTAFSPNNDGVNDCFQPLFGATVVDYDLKVYDRWGGFVFDNGGAGVGWCGAIGEQAAAEGMYVYVIGFGSEDCIYEWRTGSVLLVR